MDFAAACTDYNDTPENAEALAAAVELHPGRPVTAGDMTRAWAFIKHTGKGVPAPVIQQPPARTPPPVMPSSGAAQQTSEPDPWKIPLSELRKQVVG